MKQLDLFGNEVKLSIHEILKKYSGAYKAVGTVIENEIPVGGTANSYDIYQFLKSVYKVDFPTFQFAMKELVRRNAIEWNVKSYIIKRNY